MPTIRAMSLKGLRTLSPAVALPRETKAAAEAIQTVDTMRDKLVIATKPEQVTDVLSEAFAQTMLNMAIRRDPHVSMYGIGWIDLDDSAASVPAELDFFDTERAPGAAGTGIWGIWNNLIQGHKPLKPVLVHNVGVSIYMRNWAHMNDLVNFHIANLKLRRGKDDIFEVPLIQAAMSMCLTDAANTEGPVIDLENLASGGIAIEGHGAPFLLNEDISLIVEWPTGGAQFAQQATGVEGCVLIVARVDGEVMEPAGV